MTCRTNLISLTAAKQRLRVLCRVIEPQTNHQQRQTSVAHSATGCREESSSYPFHGFVRLTDEELAVADHPAFQRLGSVHQLGQAHLVFRGATHRRMEHCLGTLFVAQKILDSLRENYQLRSNAQPGVRHEPWGEPPTKTEKVLIRLAALVHDIGHLPAGHTLEDELRILDRHDSMARLDLVLDRSDWSGYDGPTLRTLIDSQYEDWVPRRFKASDLVIQIIAKDPPVTPLTDYPIRVELCRDIVGNTICADLLDYLHRDWYHIGKPKQIDDRLFQYMEIRGPPEKQQFVISLGRTPRIRTDAVSAILGLLEDRYNLAEIVLFHRAKCAAAAMLERALHEIEASIPQSERDDWSKRLERDLLDQSDESYLDYLLQRAEEHSCDPAMSLLLALGNRQLHKSVYAKYRGEMLGEDATQLIKLYAEGADSPVQRLHAMRLLEDDFGLQRGSLVMYCPDKAMNAKIAEVKIYLNGTIAMLHKREDDNDKELTGGHLPAQLNRFRRLWRIQVYLDQSVSISSWKEHRLYDAIDTLVVGRVNGARSLNDKAHAIAVLASKTEDMPFYGMEPLELVGTKSDQPIPQYPIGAPTLRSFFPKG